MSRFYRLSVSLTLLPLLWTGCAAPPRPPLEDTPRDAGYAVPEWGTPTSSAKRDLELQKIDFGKVGKDGAYAVVGSIRNSSTRRITLIKVIIELDGPDGSILGTTTDITDRLEPGQQWDFRAPYWLGNVQTAKVTDIEGTFQ